MGYKLAGCEVLGCVEIDKRMNEIYVRNHHPKYSFLMDIRDFNALPDEDLPSELFDLDILDGSPPCTTFSIAGQREETWGKKKKFREGQVEQTLDDLSFVFIETVKKLRPKTVIMENVEGLLFGEAWSYVQRIYKEFAAAGYTCRHHLLKSEEMGIPQTRHRVFFIALRDDVNFDIDFLNMSFDYAPIVYGDIKEGIGQPVKEGSLTERLLNIATPDDHNLADILLRTGEKGRMYNNIIEWEDRIFSTVTAKFTRFRGSDKTWVSIADIIHAQTFPEDFDFGRITIRNVGYICGMSVPPVMIKRVVTRLIESGIYQ